MKNKYEKKDSVQDRKGLSVEVRNGNVEQALRQMKKKMMKDGILQTLRDRKHFISNTEKRHKSESASKA